MEKIGSISLISAILGSSIVLSVFGYVFSVSKSADNNANEAKLEVANLRADISEVKTDVKWIKEILKKEYKIQ
ncbi:MAG: hypothetical protein QMD65_01975 [Patescibacteria group bacterium]|nr:hypothetical protein [Patescibacteria group bacterium]